MHGFKTSTIQRSRRPINVASLLIAALTVGAAQAEEASLTIAAGDDRPVAKMATTGPTPPPIDPPSAEDVDNSLRRGAQFLVGYQNDNGSWGSATRTKALNIYAPIPGAHHAFRTGTTSLCVSALVEYVESQEQPPTDVVDSLARAEAWLVKNADRLRRANVDAVYNTWGHAFAIQALVRLHNRRNVSDEKRAQYKELIAGQVDKLRRYEFVNGGWGYYDFEGRTQRPGDSPNSFVTATVLVAFYEARDLVDIPARLVRRAVTSIRRQQKPDFSYAYGEYLRMSPMYEINRPGGSLGRTQVCNLALRQWGSERVTDEVVKTWLNRLYARNGWLSIGRKRPIPHESHFAVAGYFYYYGHMYAAMCIELLPEDERPYFRQHLAHIILPLQEKNGSWWDYPLYDYHQPYGTAMAILTLMRCRDK